MNIEGKTIRLRAVEPADVDLMYVWENDCGIWPVSGTTAPFSREQMQRFVTEQQQADIFRTGQLRLIIEAPEADPPAAKREECAALRAERKSEKGEVTGTETPCPEAFANDGIASWRAVGAIDLFDFDPVARRAGVGILIHSLSDRSRGYAVDALLTLCRYTRRTLGMHQLWCDVGADNEKSLRLFRKAGFTVVGIKRDWQWHPEGYRDEVMLQKILD